MNNITNIELPFFLSKENFLLNETIEYCCNVTTNCNHHFHIYFKYLEFHEDYTVIEVNKSITNYSDNVAINKYIEKFEKLLFPAIIKVNHTGIIYEVFNSETILEKINDKYNSLLSPYNNKEEEEDLLHCYHFFNDTQKILDKISNDPVFHKLLFPLYRNYNEHTVFYKGEEKDIDTTTTKQIKGRYSATLNKNFDFEGQIEIELIGVNDYDSSYYDQTIYKFDPNTHHINYIKGEITHLDETIVKFEFENVTE